MSRERIAQATQASRDVTDAAGERPLDAITVAVLNMIRENSCLRELVNSPERITRHILRDKIRNYDSLRFEDSKEDWEFVGHSLFSGRAGREMRELFLHADLIHSVVDIVELRLNLLYRTIDHWEQLLPARSVKDQPWRSTLLSLHRQGLVEHTGPLTLWCTHCPETGVQADVSTSYVVHPVGCPRCLRPAYAVTTLWPIRPLQRMLELQDGLLGAAVGWWLHSRHIQFDAGKDVDGKEVDFLVPIHGEHLMIECKMNHVLNKDDLTGKLYENRNQLLDHLLRATRHGVRVRAAACIVNLSGRELRRYVSAMLPESDVSFQSARATLLSYEDLNDWLGNNLEMQ